MLDNLWKTIFVKVYNLIESTINKEAIDIAQDFDKIMQEYSYNNNAIEIIYFLWQLKYENADKDITWWKSLFRCLLNATKNDKDYANEIINKYLDDNVTTIINLIIKEQDSNGLQGKN